MFPRCFLGDSVGKSRLLCQAMRSLIAERGHRTVRRPIKCVELPVGQEVSSIDLVLNIRHIICHLCWTSKDQTFALNIEINRAMTCLCQCVIVALLSTAHFK